MPERSSVDIAIEESATMATQRDSKRSIHALRLGWSAGSASAQPRPLTAALAPEVDLPNRSMASTESSAHFSFWSLAESEYSVASMTRGYCDQLFGALPRAFRYAAAAAESSPAP